MNSERLFIGLALPEAVKEAVGTLEIPVPGIRWSRRDQLHVTMRFLGDVEEDRTGGILTRLGTIHVAPFILPVEGVGAFPPKGLPAVIWAGTGNGHPLLFQLRQKLDDALLATGLDLDVRVFHPHVTLARCSPEAAGAASEWLKRHRDFAGPAFRVDAFGLYASRLLPQGAEHALKRAFPLGARPA